MERTDPLEIAFIRIMNENHIFFTCPERNSSTVGTLDFYLPDYDLYVEVKAYSCERLHGQIERTGYKSGIMVLIGLKAIESFGYLIQGLQIFS